MATLILSTVGRVFGGRIGAAIGAGVGQVIDGALVKPKGRQGPRLTELAVQTSAYGTQIPKLFGTMRVAGCVIWSTALIESRNTSRSGKGQPTTTNYSYAASFAVALSARPILGVGRIWADGKLLRGAAGDFKTMTGFRLHLGSEDQDADPVIASAEGGMAPAHRGIAYAVFENFQLADYGNRLPSLTFEVTADADAVGIGLIATALGNGSIDGDPGLPTLHGFSAYGDSVRGVIETLAAASGAWFVPVGSRLRMTATTEPTATLMDSGYATGTVRGDRRTRAVQSIDRVPKSVTVAHYDPAREYQTGVQRARRPGAGNRDERIDMPAALSADAAKTLAEASLARAENARERRTLKLGWADLGITPGACVTIGGTPGRWRVSGWTLTERVLTLECLPIAPATLVATASSGRSLAADDAVAGVTTVYAFESPPLDDSILSAPRLTIAAGGASSGWRRAALLYSIDEGASWQSAGATPGPAIFGTITAALGAAPTTLFDEVTRLDVTLAHDGLALTGADDGALDRGANIALVGAELLQFGRAVQTGAATWRLSRLLRGRRGTDAAIGTQPAGDRFLLIEPDALTSVELPLASLGRRVRVLASGVGDVAGPAEAQVTLAGTSILPPAPVHLRADRLATGGVVLRWVRRSRAGWRWIDAVDVPLAEEREEYRVTITPADGVVRAILTSVPLLALSAADLSSGAVRIGVTQRGSYGESAAAEIDLTTD